MKIQKKVDKAPEVMKIKKTLAMLALHNKETCHNLMDDGVQINSMPNKEWLDNRTEAELEKIITAGMKSPTGFYFDPTIRLLSIDGKQKIESNNLDGLDLAGEDYELDSLDIHLDGSTLRLISPGDEQYRLLEIILSSNHDRIMNVQNSYQELSRLKKIMETLTD